MATRTINQNGPDQNYANGANWLQGVAPTTGDTVIINAQPMNGPITAMSLAITGQTITLSNNKYLYTTGNSSFDSATTLTDTNASSNQDLQFGDFFTNNGTIINPNNILVTNTTTNTSEVPDFLNNANINYTTAQSNNQIGAYSINGAGVAGGGSSGQVFFTDNGTVTISSPAGANYGPAETQIPTEVTIHDEVNGSGTFNVTGTSTTTDATTITDAGSGPVATESSLTFQLPVLTTTNASGQTVVPTYNLNDGQVEFDDVSLGTVNLQGTGNIVVLPNITSVSSNLVIRGFQAGDAIGLGPNSGITRAAYNTSTGLVDLFTAAGSAGVSLDLVATGTQNFATATFTIVNGLTADTNAGIPTGDGQGGTNVPYLETNAAAPCYCPGTLIRTDRGDVPVEHLAIGDRVITLDGSAEPIRWLGRRAFDGRFVQGRRDILPVCVRAGALGDGLPLRDLWVSPLHAMYLDGGLVPAGDLVNGVSVTQETAVDRVEYIHIELGRHNVIWAEGAASESFVDDNSRAMFHNAHEFDALYPGMKRTAAVYCAPRIVDGEVLDRLRREIDSRAGLYAPGIGAALRGSIDGRQGVALRGWAQDLASPDVPVCIEILVGSQVVARTLANQFRQDLRAAGLGSGCHGFRVDLPAQTDGAVTLRRAADGAPIANIARRAA